MYWLANAERIGLAGDRNHEERPRMQYDGGGEDRRNG